MLKQTKNNVQSFLFSFVIAIVAVSSFSVYGALTTQAQGVESGTCGTDPNQAEFYHGDTFGLYMAPPVSAGGSYSDYMYSPTSWTIPNAIMLRDPDTATSPGPYFDFQQYVGRKDVSITGTYRDVNGVIHNVACTAHYVVRICQGYNQYGVYDKPCHFSGGGGGGGGPEPGFTLSCAPFSRSVQPGDSTTYTITMTASGGFSEPVSIYTSTPPGASAAVRNVTPGGSVIIPITTTNGISAGIHSLTFSGILGSGPSADAFCDLVVQRPAYVTPVYTTPPYQTPYTTPPYATPGSGNFVMNCAPPFRSVDQGDSTTFSVQVSASGGSNSPVGVSASIVPSGPKSPTISVIPASIVPPGSSNILVTTAADTVPGTYTIIIRAVYDTIVKTCTVTLDVRANTVCPPNCPGPYQTPYGTPYQTPVYNTPPIVPNLSLSDKDIIAVNGVLNPNASSANSISDIPSRITFKAGDVVRFKINIFNSGSAPITSASITDSMFHLRAAPSPSVSFEGCTGSSSVAGGGAEFTFRINGAINPNTICSVSFDAIITAPPGVAEGIDRFQNVGVIAGDNISHTVKTPFLLFTIGKVPTKEEVAP